MSEQEVKDAPSAKETLGSAGTAVKEGVIDRRGGV